jgi:3-dehydroquinate dehydratase/shikimate dehydrogenase
VEVRADLTGDFDPAPLRSGFSGGLLYTLRSTSEGGRCDDPPELRRRRLIAAASRFDLIDLEHARDLDPEVLSLIPPERRVLSWQGHAAGLSGLRATLAHVTRTPALLYRLAPWASTPRQALVPLRLLKSIGRDDVIAYASGDAGAWTRVLAARFGAPAVFGRLGDPPERDGDGAPPVHRLVADYRLSLVSRATRVYGIIGRSTSTSLSPLIHNTGYLAAGLPALFLPFNATDLPAALGELHAGLADLGLPLLGATVVTPHKDTTLSFAALATREAQRARAANLLVQTPRGWAASNEARVISYLTSRRVDVAGRRVAVIGCGGSGRAAATGLTAAGARVTLVNRGMRRGQYAAELLGLPFVPLTRFDPRGFAALVHATTVKDDLPFGIDGADAGTVIFDLNYGVADTPLIAAARAAGHPTIEGKDMLVAEVSRQFHGMTGHRLPTAETRAALGMPAAAADDDTGLEQALAAHHGQIPVPAPAAS